MEASWPGTPGPREAANAGYWDPMRGNSESMQSWYASQFAEAPSVEGRPHHNTSLRARPKTPAVLIMGADCDVYLFPCAQRMRQLT